MCDRNDISYLSSVPRLEISSNLNNIPNLSDFDIERNITPQINFNYYAIDDFVNNHEIGNLISKDSLSVLHCNIRSLAANFDNLSCLLSDVQYQFDIVGLSEIKFNVNKDNISNISIPNFSFIFKPSLTNATGVGFYIKNDIQFHIRDDLNSTVIQYETLYIEAECKSQSNIVCCIIYRHPNSSLDIFSDHLIATVDKISREHKFCIIMGDFNINLLNYRSHQPTDDFLNALGSYCIQPHILQPTRITDHSATLIDVFLNSIEHYTVSGNIIYDITDHLPNFLIISKISRVLTKLDRYRRDYSKLNEQDLINETQSVNWDEILPSSNDANEIFNYFYSQISTIIDKHAPIIKLSNKQAKTLSKPWITNGLRASITINNKLYKSYIKTRNKYYHSKFKYYRNKIKHLLLISKKSYYNNYFLNNSKNIKGTWFGIKQLVTLKQSKSNFPDKITINNSKITDPINIANSFNKYFASIGPNLSEIIPNVNCSIHDYLGEQQSQSVFLIPTTPDEIEREIDGLIACVAGGIRGHERMGS